MGKVLDPTPAPSTPAPAAADPGDMDGRRVTVYLNDDQERDLIHRHAADLGMPTSALLRRLAATGVRATTRAGVSVRQLVDGVGDALARDFPLSFGVDHPKRQARVAASVTRWLLSRCAVLPLPAPTAGSSETGPVWQVRMDDGSVLDITRHDGKVSVGGRAFSPREWQVVAAAGIAATTTPPDPAAPPS